LSFFTGTGAGIFAPSAFKAMMVTNYLLNKIEKK
jgi:hypothetical protein